MEKYHIYEEIGKGEFSQVFKGREKKKIEYVAIKRVDKGMMNKVVNEVQIMHKLNCPHILKFFDWYETRNNLWLILEYCTGSDLATILKQDEVLPINSIRLFALDILSGLKYLHSLGVLHCDIRPQNFLIDEYGILKFTDFKFSRKIPKLPLGDSVIPSRGVPTSMAPELFSSEGVHSFSSDLWAFGCLLFELRFGTCLFTSLPQAITDISELLFPPTKRLFFNQSSPIIAPDDVSSQELVDLIYFLVEINPTQRCDWETLSKHPFFSPYNIESPSLQPHLIFETLVKNIEKLRQKQIEAQMAEQFDFKIDSFNDVAAPPPRAVSDCTPVRPNSKSSISKRNVPGTQLEGLSQTPQTLFQEGIKSPGLAEKSSKISYSNSNKFQSQHESDRPPWSYADVLLYQTELQVKPIIGNRNIEYIEQPEFSSSSLEFSPLSTSDIQSMSQSDLDAFLSQMYKSLSKSLFQGFQNSGNVSHLANLLFERNNILAYLTSVATSIKIANLVLNTNFLFLLTKILKIKTDSRNKQINHLILQAKTLICSLLAILTRYATFIQPPSPKFSEEHIIDSLLPLIKHSNDIQLKRRAVAALGEILFYISAQNETNQDIKWTVSDQIFLLLTELISGEDRIVQMYAGKTIENILSQDSNDCRKHFLTSEFCEIAFEVSLHSQVEYLQIISSNILCYLYSTIVRNGLAIKFDDLLKILMEKNRLVEIIEILKDGSQKVLASFISILNFSLFDTNFEEEDNFTAQINKSSRLFLNYLVKFPSLIPVLIRISEQSSNLILRAKAIITIFSLFHHSNDSQSSNDESKISMAIIKSFDISNISERSEFLDSVLRFFLNYLNRSTQLCFRSLIEVLKTTSSLPVETMDSPEHENEKSNPHSSTILFATNRLNQLNLVISHISLRRFFFNEANSNLFGHFSACFDVFNSYRARLGSNMQSAASITALDRSLLSFLETISQIDFSRTVSDPKTVLVSAAPLELTVTLMDKLFPCVFRHLLTATGDMKVLNLACVRALLPNVIKAYLSSDNPSGSRVMSVLGCLIEMIPNLMFDHPPLPQYFIKTFTDILSCSKTIVPIILELFTSTNHCRNLVQLLGISRSDIPNHIVPKIVTILLTNPALSEPLLRSQLMAPARDVLLFNFDLFSRGSVTKSIEGQFLDLFFHYIELVWCVINTVVSKIAQFEGSKSETQGFAKLSNQHALENRNLVVEALDILPLFFVLVQEYILSELSAKSKSHGGGLSNKLKSIEQSEFQLLDLLSRSIGAIFDLFPNAFCDFFFQSKFSLTANSTETVIGISPTSIVRDILSAKRISMGVRARFLKIFLSALKVPKVQLKCLTLLKQDILPSFEVILSSVSNDSESKSRLFIDLMAEIVGIIKMVK